MAICVLWKLSNKKLGILFDIILTVCFNFYKKLEAYLHRRQHITRAISNRNRRHVSQSDSVGARLSTADVTAIVFERPLRGTNVNSKASRTYRLLADIWRMYSSCAACLCLQSYFWVRRIFWLLKMTEKQDQRICIKFCF